MPVITSIRRNVKNQGRCSIFVDDVFLAACPIDVALGMGLRKGLELTSEMERQLRAEDRQMIFKQKAHRFATYKPRTERQILTHLEKLGCVPEEVEYLMTWLREFRLVDDKGYAERFIAAAKERKPLSRNGARATLLRKGIPAETADAVLESEYSPEVSIDAARRVAEKKLRGIRASSPDETKQKLVRFMQYRGFSWDVIRTVVADLFCWFIVALTLTVTLSLGVALEANAQGILTCDRRPLPSSINRYQPTTVPVVSHDGAVLYLDRKQHPDNTEGPSDNDDIWMSRRLASGEWTSPVQEPLTTFRRPDVLFNITVDGRSALVVGRYRVVGRDTVQCFAIISRDADTGLFTRYEPIVLPNERVIGKNFYGFLAEDRTTLLLALNRADSKGDLDLYMSKKCNDRWDAPVSLGSILNTTSFEGSPWLGRDSRTLYFASSGRDDRRGKSDLYMSRRIGDGWQQWTTPVNLGPCVNTTEDETSLSIVNNSDTALISSYDFETERPALFAVTLSSLTPKPYVIFSARIYDAVTGDPLPAAEVAVIDSPKVCKTEELFSVSDGKVSLVFNEHSRYLIRTTAKHYVPHVQTIGVRGIDSVTPLVLSIRMFDTRRPLASVYFDRGSSVVSLEQRRVLDSLLAKYEVRNINFSVVGYTDEIGTRPFNQTLSSMRADAILAELVRLGIDESRVASSGRGIEMLGLNTGLSENPASRRVDIFPTVR